MELKVMISSDAGKVGEAGYVVYACAKVAINHLAKCLVQEISRYGVRINVVSPGTAKTPMAVSSGWNRIYNILERFPEEHCKKSREILEERGWPEEYIRAIVSHGWGICSEVEPQVEMGC